MKKILITSITTLIAYALIGFFYAPNKIKEILVNKTYLYSGMSLEVQDLEFNPFTFNLIVKQLTIKDSQKQPWFDTKMITANFNPTHLLWNDINFSSMVLDQPHVQAVLSEQNEMILPAWQLPITDSASNTIDLSIDHIDINQGQVVFTANNIKQNFSFLITNLSFKQHRFNLSNDDSDFTLNLMTDADEQLTLDGTYNHSNQSLNGNWQLTNGQLSTWQKAITDDLGLKSGKLDANGTISWLLPRLPVITVNDLALASLSIKWQEHITLSDFLIEAKQLIIDFNEQQINGQLITSKQGTIDLITPLPINEHNPVDDSTQQISEWQWQIDQFDLDQLLINWQDKITNGQAIKLTLAQLQGKQINNQGIESEWQAILKNQNQGELTMNARLDLKKQLADADINIKQWQLAPYSTLLNKQDALKIDQGQLFANQHIIWENENFSMHGSLVLNELFITNRQEQPALQLNHLTVASTSLNLKEKHIHLDNITIDQASGQLSMNKEDMIDSLTSPEITTGNESNQWKITLGHIQ